jgi:hypothetical protein
MKTVLILAHEHRPYQRSASTIGAQRTYAFAKFLPLFNYKVIVLCCDGNRRRQLDPADFADFKKTIPHLVNQQKELLTRVYPLPSLKFSGVVDYLWFKTVSMQSNGLFLPKIFFLSNLIRPLLSLLKQLTKGDYSSSWGDVAYVVAEEILKKDKIDYILAEHSPDSSIFIAKKLHDKYKIPWGIDYRDFVLIPFENKYLNLFKTHHSKLIKTASFFINVTPGWSKLFKHSFRKDSYTLTNGYDADDFRDNLEFRSKSNYFSIVYTGSIYIEYQDFPVFMEGLSLFIDSLEDSKKKIIRFEYCGSAFEYVKEVAQKYSLLKYCNISKNLPRETALDMMICADVLLLMGSKKGNKFHSGKFYPGKTFEYFYTKNFILTIPNDGGDLHEIIQDYGNGNSCDTSEEVYDCLRARFEGGYKKNKMNDSPIQKYNREIITKELSEILNNL